MAVEKGTTEQADAQKQSTKCKAAGKPAVTVLPFPDQNGANLALSSGRAELGFADSPVAAYQVKQSNGQFKLVGPSLRERAVRARDPQDQRAGQADAGRAQGADAERHVQGDPDEVGRPAGAITPSQVKINGATS